ncbi:hypothetical protein EYF80_027350 [Liparis tanakae]|uniref:Uncharacterized protein n=1 Tax=Liparis tanakae TaxID=230148 RepID=A0A4Z2HCE0_9TELE|nr:hypothetical protein EYF80_027350 [Liparis tanakae]
MHFTGRRREAKFVVSIPRLLRLLPPRPAKSCKQQQSCSEELCVQNQTRGGRVHSHEGRRALVLHQITVEPNDSPPSSLFLHVDNQDRLTSCSKNPEVLLLGINNMINSVDRLLVKASRASPRHHTSVSGLFSSGPAKSLGRTAVLQHARPPDL